MIQNQILKISKRIRSPFSGYITFSALLFFTISCLQESKITVKKNSHFPKEITLKPNIVKIIDSIFVFKNEVQTLEAIDVFDLKNGILVFSERKYYVDQQLNQTTHDRFDQNGNLIESHTILHFKNSDQHFTKKLDEYGNISQLTSTDGSQAYIFHYKNSYAHNRLSEVAVSSENTGAVFERTQFTYDSNGNVTEQWVKDSSGDVKNIYQYNQDQKVILYKHLENGALNDSIIYTYDQGLLTKQEWFESQFPNPTVEHYFYNKAKQLVLVRQGKSNDKTEYKDYDELNNWLVKEQYVYGTISRLTKRKFLLR